MGLIGVVHSPAELNPLADGAPNNPGQLAVSRQVAREAARPPAMVAAGAAVAVMEALIRKAG